MDKTKLNNKAYQKLSMLKPVTNTLQNQTTNALITKRNNPKVKSVILMVSICKIGFKNKFSKVSTTTTVIEVQNPSTLTPGKKLANNITNNAVIIKLIMILNILIRCF